MFLGLFISAEDSKLVCGISALLIKIYFDLSLIWLVINMLLRMEKLEIYIYIYTCWVAEDLIFSCFMEKIYSDLVLFFF